MGIEFNKENAVFRQDPTYYDQVETGNQFGQDVFGSSIQFQTNKYVFHAGTGIGTYTTTLTEDIVLTLFSYNISTGAPGGGAATVAFSSKINGVNFINVSGTTGTDGQIVVANVLPLPNWKFPAGTTFSVTIAGSGSPAGSIEFIGFVL
jgi:hypothetical protein